MPPLALAATMATQACWRLPLRCRFGRVDRRRPGGSMRRQRPPPQHRAHPGRRFGIRRAGVLRTEENPHADPGPHGRRGNPLHAGLQRLSRLRAVAVRADDGPARRPRLHPRQPRGPARGTGADSRRDGHAGRAAQGGRLCHRGGRQVGPGSARQLRRPAPPGLRFLLRV